VPLPRNILKSILILNLVLILNPASGSQDQAYGLGDRSAGRVGSVTADAANPYAALYNPALLAAQQYPTFAFSTASAVASFAPLRNVRLATSEGRAGESGEFKLPDSHLTLWSAGYATAFDMPRWMERRGGFGLALSGPYQTLRTYSASTPQDFFPLRYGTSDAQFKATLSGAVEVIPEYLMFGAGVSLYIVTGGNAEVAVTGDNPSGRLALDVGLRAAPVAGLYFENGGTGASLVFREAIDPVFQQSFTGTVPVAGDTVVKQPVLVRTSLYYEPRLLEGDLQHNFGFATISAGIAYQQWTSWKAAFLTAEVPDSSGNTHRTQVPSIGMRDTWSPRVSFEVPLVGERLSFAAGYQFRPSPVKDVSGAANPLDTDIHVVGASFHHHLGEVEWLPFELNWGLYAQYHWMKNRTVNKASGADVGAPGYSVQGHAYAFGVTVGADL